MWSKDEAASLKQAFWTAFGHYMRPVQGAAGEPAKWLNYPTGVPHLYFRAFAGKTDALLGIEITNVGSDSGARLVAQLNAVQGLLRRFTKEDWQWLPAEDRSPDSAFFGTQLSGVSVYRQQDWPTLISFFKPRLVALDAFWQEARWGFE